MKRSQATSFPLRFVANQREDVTRRFDLLLIKDRNSAAGNLAILASTGELMGFLSPVPLMPRQVIDA